MKKFLINIILFFLIAIGIGEVVVRLTHAVSDIPQRKIDDYGIQKYYPNQDGYWLGGNHKWTVNKLGWPGELPDNYSNLIMIIGDSFIENFMNPNECHQSILLKENMPKYNFMEAGRSGVSFIEGMEITKQTNFLKPIQSLIYVNDIDFYESIYEIKPLNDITQLNIKKREIIYGEMKSPKLKKVLYSWKLLYYFYNRFNIPKVQKKTTKSEPTLQIPEKNSIIYRDEILKLIQYTSENYNLNDKTLVFHPNTSNFIIDSCKKAEFNVIILDSKNDKNWTFNHDRHWTCYGHKRVARQVSNGLLKQIRIK